MLPKGANFSTYSHSSCHRLKPLRVQRRNRPHWVSNYWNQMGFCLQVKVRRPKGWFTYEICCGITDPLKSLASPGYQRNHAGLGIFFHKWMLFYVLCHQQDIFYLLTKSHGLWLWEKVCATRWVLETSSPPSLPRQWTRHRVPWEPAARFSWAMERPPGPLGASLSFSLSPYF